MAERDVYADLRTACENRLAGRSVDSFIDPEQVLALIKCCQQAEDELQGYMKDFHRLADKHEALAEKYAWRAANASTRYVRACDVVTDLTGDTAPGGDDA